MRPSPIQLQHVLYEKVLVQPHGGEQAPAVKGIALDFNGVNIRSVIRTGLKAGQQEDPRDFLIRLSVTIDNKEGKKIPYDLDIGVLGVFNVLPSLPIERREDLVTVNGASILYGVIREMVLSLTSRFSPGALTLPGMNFEDNAPSKQKVADGAAPSLPQASLAKRLPPTRKSASRAKERT